MKALLEKLYFLAMGPLYRRLSRDNVLHMQELKRAQLEYQERLTARICDQLIASSLSAGTTQQSTAKLLSKYTDEQVIEFAELINRSEDLVVLSKQKQVPLRDLAVIYSRYGGMSPIAIRKLREMESLSFAPTDAPVAGHHR